MRVYRLCREKYKYSLSGRGAAMRGQRWNSRGVEMIYTSSSRALAVAELSAHIPLGILPKDYHMVEISIPENIEILTIDINSLPHGWNHIPRETSSQEIGDKFILENKYAVMKVPSVSVKGDFNFLINPHHPEFSTIKITSAEIYQFDPRHFKL